MKKFFVGGFLVLAALFASCSKSDDTGAGGEASVVVRITTLTRAALPDGVAGAEVLSAENGLKSFTAYVFNYSTGMLEAKASGNVNNKQVTLTGLNSGSQKRIVITANTDVAIAPGGNYNEFKTKLIDLDDQPYDYATLTAGGSPGFAMFGEKSPVSLNEGENTAEIGLSRLVAKVTLGKVKVDIETDPGAEGYLGYTQENLDNFKVTGVTMQKVIGNGGFLGDQGDVFYGGITDTGLASSVQKGYLYDSGWDFSFTNGQVREPGNYFYVMPNDGGADKHYTMMTVVAEYYGQPTYFPVIINKSKNVDDKTEGLVENNHWYSLDLTIKDLAGSENPEVPKGEASLKVDVTVLNWVVVPPQEEDW